MLAAALSIVLVHADISALYSDRETCQVTARIEVEAQQGLSEVRIEHTLRLDEPQSVTDYSVVSADGAAHAILFPSTPIARLVVALTLARPSFSYVLSYEVRGVSRDCPLPVAGIPPKAPHRTVALRVALPEGETVRGALFPNLERDAKGLHADLGAIPAYVRVPRGSSILATHLVDGIALSFIFAATLFWYRRRNAHE